MTHSRKIELEGQLINSIMNDEREFFVKGKYVNLPLPQKAGTYAQQVSYARSKAWEIIEKLD